MRLDRGYVSPDGAAERLRLLHAADPLTILLNGLVFLGSVLPAWLVVAQLLSRAPLWGILIYPIVLVFVARQLRAIELIVHDASHYNFFRRQRQLNDWLANGLFAAPVGQTVAEYRVTHLRHHKGFGGSSDPCRRRMEDLARTDPSVRDRRKWAFWPNAKYMRSYYESVAPSYKGVLLFLAWHLVVGAAATITLVSLSNCDPASAILAWPLVWVVPMLTSLPFLRMRAERDEHDYFEGETEFTATITSEGFWNNLLFHPWHDAYHLLHHLYPDIPQTKHRQAHRILDEVDPAYRLRRTNRL